MMRSSRSGSAIDAASALRPTARAAASAVLANAGVVASRHNTDEVSFGETSLGRLEY